MEAEGDYDYEELMEALQRVFGIAAICPVVQDVYKRQEMEDALGSRIQSYSYGMRRKIMVMGALMHQPPVWILDEPLTGLDPKSAFALKEMMKEHAAQGKSVLFSTHVLEVAEKLCDYVAIVQRGRICLLCTS